MATELQGFGVQTADEIFAAVYRKTDDGGVFYKHIVAVGVMRGQGVKTDVLFDVPGLYFGFDF